MLYTNTHTHIHISMFARVCVQKVFLGKRAKQHESNNNIWRKRCLRVAVVASTVAVAASAFVAVVAV